MRLIALAAVIALAGVACSSSDDGGAVTPEADVLGTTANVFEPKDLSVAAGESVSWAWEGVHNVVADDDSFTSGEPVENGTFEHTFDAAGTVPYYCSIHGAAGGTGMAGTITVT